MTLKVWQLAVPVVLCALSGVVALTAYTVYVNFFEAGGLFVTENREVDKAYRLNTKGDDLRVYEFTPDGSPGTVCIVVAGERNSVMECEQKTGVVEPSNG